MEVWSPTKFLQKDNFQDLDVTLTNFGGFSQIVRALGNS